MLKVSTKKNKEGYFEIECSEKHTCTLEFLSIIDYLIRRLEEHEGYSFRKTLKLIKQIRKCADLVEINEDINNTKK